MGRWTQYDEDEYHLPHGVRRVGYDADEGRYYYEDQAGAVYDTPPHVRYGGLRKVDAGHEGHQGAAPFRHLLGEEVHSRFFEEEEIAPLLSQRTLEDVSYGPADATDRVRSWRNETHAEPLVPAHSSESTPDLEADEVRTHSDDSTRSLFNSVLSGSNEAVVDFTGESTASEGEKDDGASVSTSHGDIIEIQRVPVPRVAHTRSRSHDQSSYRGRPSTVRTKTELSSRTGLPTELGERTEISRPGAPPSFSSVSRAYWRIRSGLGRARRAISLQRPTKDL